MHYSFYSLFLVKYYNLSFKILFLLFSGLKFNFYFSLNLIKIIPPLIVLSVGFLGEAINVSIFCKTF